MSGSEADRTEKRARLQAVREPAGADALLLTSPSRSWYLEGIRSHVSLAGPLSRRCGSAPPATPCSSPTTRPTGSSPSSCRATPPASCVFRGSPRRPTRPPLRGGRGRSIGRSRPPRGAREPAPRRARPLSRPRPRTAAVAMTDAAADARSEHSERAIAADLGRRLIAQGIDPLVILVAGESRLAHRHPLPTDAALRRRAMLVVCGRRHGLIANVTRWVGASSPGEDAILRVGGRLLRGDEARCAASTRCSRRVAQRTEQKASASTSGVATTRAAPRAMPAAILARLPRRATSCRSTMPSPGTPAPPASRSKTRSSRRAGASRC